MGVVTRLVTVLTLAFIVTIIQLGTSSAFDLQFGARVRTNFGYTIDEAARSENRSNSVTRGFFMVPGSSYFRATFTSDDKKIGLRAEMGLSSVSLVRRHVFGWYRMGNFRVVIGHTDTYLDTFYAPNQVLDSTDLEGWGVVKSLRQPVIRLDWQHNDLEAQIAIREHRTDMVPINLDTTGVDVYWIAPSVVGVVRYTSKYFAINPAFQWAMTQYEGDDPGNDDYAHSWVVKLPAKIMFGPFTLSGDIHYGHNLAGEFTNQPEFALPVVMPSGDIENTLSYGGFAALQFKQESWSITTGAGYEKYANDAWSRTLGYLRDEYHRLAWYLNFAYNLHQNLTIFPELMYQEAGEEPTTGEIEGARWYAGVQIRFLF